MRPARAPQADRVHCPGGCTRRGAPQPVPALGRAARPRPASAGPCRNRRCQSLLPSARRPPGGYNSYPRVAATRPEGSNWSYAETKAQVTMQMHLVPAGSYHHYCRHDTTVASAPGARAAGAASSCAADRSIGYVRGGGEEEWGAVVVPLRPPCRGHRGGPVGRRWRRRPTQWRP